MGTKLSTPLGAANKRIEMIYFFGAHNERQWVGRKLNAPKLVQSGGKNLEPLIDLARAEQPKIE